MCRRPSCPGTPFNLQLPQGSLLQPQTSLTPPSPGATLERQRTSPSPSPTVERRKTPSSPGATADPSVGASTEKQRSPPAHGASTEAKKSGGSFVVCSGSPNDSAVPQTCEGSEVALPSISVLSDSQFDSSSDSQFSLGVFRIKQPPDRPPDIPPASFLRQVPSASSLFSNVGASRRSNRQSGDEGGGDPYEFHSQSQNDEVRVKRVRRRAREEEGEAGEGARASLTGSGSSESGHTPSNGQDVSQVSSNEASDPSTVTPLHPLTSSHGTAPSTQPASSSTDTLLHPLTSSHGTSTATLIHPLASTSSATPLLPVTPSPLTPHSSPASSHLVFTSPSRFVSPDSLRDLSHPYIQEGTRYVLRHVQTYRTVVEQHVISVEVLDGGTVVEGLSQCWQVRSCNVLGMHLYM